MTLANALSGEHLKRSKSALSPPQSESQLSINSNPPSDHAIEEPDQNFDVSHLKMHWPML